ncbi:MAG: DNA-directed RNA polymerase subunit beta' [Chloroflexi bacterium]|nr:DNA-directed RNA polymerase subunit beta' [Chloroflexota bacterium]
MSEIKDFNAIRIGLASPEAIRNWSHGEVLKPETINYRRLRPERDGLFDEAIFGPTKDYQCYCGKYKKIRYKGIVCDKCHVEVTRSSVRRERMGHIELASPVAHIWYTRRVPSYLGLLLDMSRRNLDRTLYFAQYVVVAVDEDARRKSVKVLDDAEAREMKRVKEGMVEKIDKAKARLEDDLAKKRGQREANLERLETKYNDRLQEIDGELHTVEKRLTDDQGTTVRKPIEYPRGSKEVLVAEGETIDRKHLRRFKELEKGEKSELQDKLKDDQANSRANYDVELERIKAEAQERFGHLDDELDREQQAVQTKYEDLRDELRSLAVMDFMTESRFRELNDKYPGVFRAGMGAEALYEIVQNIDLERMAKELRAEMRATQSRQRRKKATKRLAVVEALRKSANRPEWMILTVLPVIPPELRPMVQLDGGRFATSDLNDLYRRVINRNNRLKRLLELGAPDVIVRNEKRMLQEAVDSLIDNSRRGKAVSLRGKRKLKSLSDMLKGKQGRFRRNLLGKRVDYSGRSVIVVGPHLRLHECGLPKRMALELFKPFVVNKLVENNFAHNVKGAKRIIEQMKPEVWEVLEEVVHDYPILLNRAPTLHRLGIQAFLPTLVDGDAIQIHPLVCEAFNADFDGDQMAVHIPLSEAAKAEARGLMLSSHNLLRPANGEPIVGPSKDMVLGCYYLTMDEEGPHKGDGKTFGSIDEVTFAYEAGQIGIHAKVKYWFVAPGKKKGEVIETTVGRCLFNAIVPEDIRFCNDTYDKGKLKKLISDSFYKLGADVTAKFVDDIKDIGFKFATRSGLTIALSDINVPETKQAILDAVGAQVTEVERQYRRGLITEDEKYVKTVELWTKATDDVTDQVQKAMNPRGPIYIMATSGATKGGFQPIRQLAGMRGLMADPVGRIISLPIRSNFREGLTALEYFISTHGARKGLADTALRTADAGYLTRRLVDVAQESIINSEDCGTEKGIILRAPAPGSGLAGLAERVLGRVTVGPLRHPKTKEILLPDGEMIIEDHLEMIKHAGVTEVRVRSPMTCELRYGICAKCYGRDMARNGLVMIGEAVGVIAAQSIGEPGTQLTLRTFHTGGVAGEADITRGLPRVQELFEARNPKGEAIVAEISGTAHVERDGDQRLLKIISSSIARDEYDLPGNYKVLTETGEQVDDGAVLAKRGEKEIVARFGGKITVGDGKIVVRRESRDEVEYDVPPTARLRVEENDKVAAGQQLTDGALNPHTILKIKGREAVQQYLLDEVQKVYRSQGVAINDKHIEVIMRQLLRRVKVRTVGESQYLSGQLVDALEFAEMNQSLLAEGKRPSTAVPQLLGITKAALNTESFLAASSFQHTINVLASAAIEGKRDDLHGLKENVIIGKLIPAGTGFKLLEGAAALSANPGISTALSLPDADDDELDDED